MTKAVRIENADTSAFKLCVYTEDKQADGTWVRDPEPTKLHYPTQLMTMHVHSSRRLVIEEAPVEQTPQNG